MKKFLIIILSGILMLYAAGCSQGSLRNSKENPAIRGEITKVEQSQDGKSATLLIEGQKEKDTQHDKASVTIKSDTKIYKSNLKENFSVAELKKGMKVEVYWDGPVMESYPVQIGANTIIILQ